MPAASAAPPAAAPPALSAPQQRGQALLEHGDNGKSLPSCNNCHGPASSGLAPSGPALSGQPASYLKSQFAAWTAGTRHNDSDGMMQGIVAKLAPDDMDALTSYLGTLQRLPK
jgi:cytochrome c553